MSTHHRKRHSVLGKNRVEAFSDGVFAVAMTLLVLNLQSPELYSMIVGIEVQKTLAVFLPRFFVYVLSFIIVGIYWVAHHNTFHYIRNADRNLLWLNILLLICIVFIPFATALLGQYPQYQISILIYGSTLIVTGITLQLLWSYATRHHRLVEKDIDPQLVRRATRRNIMAPCIYLLALLASFVNLDISLIIFAIVPVIYILPGRVDQHWHHEHHLQHSEAPHELSVSAQHSEVSHEQNGHAQRSEAPSEQNGHSQHADAPHGQNGHAQHQSGHAQHPEVTHEQGGHSQHAEAPSEQHGHAQVSEHAPALVKSEGTRPARRKKIAGQTFFERQIAALEKLDPGVLLEQYHPDATIASFDFVVEGHEAIREHFEHYLEHLGVFKLKSIDKFVETPDAIFFEATMTSQHGEARVYNIFLLHEEKATHHFTGVISSS